MSNNRQVSVVVTGLGATTPLGGDVASTWSAMLAGTSGVRTITEPWIETVPVKFAATAAVDPVAEPWDRAARPAQPTVMPVARTAPVASDGRSTSSRVRMVAIAAVLLCVLAVLLAIFA